LVANQQHYFGGGNVAPFSLTTLGFAVPSERQGVTGYGFLVRPAVSAFPHFAALPGAGPGARGGEIAVPSAHFSSTKTAALVAAGCDIDR
ncbi:MAG: hypothetical protein OEN23_21635, partial [Paracoccaceae bacterium]|nr:hypothetical protein [Paracoccaceae bacterium]